MMASLAESRPSATRAPWMWLFTFLKQELAPYPGRAWTVARMTLAATLMMLWIMTFRVPGAALGAYYTLLFSRDSPQATLHSAVSSIAAVGCSLCVVLVSGVLLAGNPVLHFCWVAGMLFLNFFLITGLAEYRLATAFGFLAVTTLTGWDFPANTELRVEGTLWSALAVALAACITVGIEFVSQRIHPYDQLTEGLSDRIHAVEAALDGWGNNREADEAARQKLVQYAMTGTASLRRLLLRSRDNRQTRGELSAIVALAGRLVDLGAAMNDLHISLSADDRKRCLAGAQALRAVRHAGEARDLRAIAGLRPNLSGAANPLLADLESTIELMPRVFASELPLFEYLPSAVDAPSRLSIWKADAFSNPHHVRFALKGTLAAIFCYVLYNAIAWPGLSTAVSTCVITALSTVGSSRQKQILRVIGALVGGVCLGMSAQVFLLPHMDSITSFTLLFAGITAFASWIATSSPRLSYLGVQTAFAFYITHLRTFGPQTSLAVARDDVAGILLGLGAMWLFFDRIWAENSAANVLGMFISNLRRIADWRRPHAGLPAREVINQARAQRAAINAQFDVVRNESDALFFEFGAGWPAKVKLRNQIRAWQPQLRTYFLLQIALLHHLLQNSESPVPVGVRGCVERSNELLRSLADWKSSPQPEPPEGLLAALASAQRQESGSENLPSGVPDMDSVASSMLHVAVELATEMIADSSSTSRTE